MREIKFRAWDKQSKKMVYYNEDCSAPDMTLNGVLISHDKQSNVSAQYILMQSTGLKDKTDKGEEAYVDDIARDKHGQIFVIEWDYPLLARLQEIWFEIIGNIHENPELLERPK